MATEQIQPAPQLGSEPAAAVRAYPAPIGWVIAAIILFWPTAIPALLASHRSARAAGAGDVALADKEASTAKRWGAISVILGAALVLLSILTSIVWVVLVLVWHHDHDGRAFRIEGPTNVQPFDRGHGWGSQQRGIPQPDPTPRSQ